MSKGTQKYLLMSENFLFGHFQRAIFCEFALAYKALKNILLFLMHSKSKNNIECVCEK